MRFLDAEFVQGFIRMANDGWEQGWHERNGGNLSYRVKPEEVELVKENEFDFLIENQTHFYFIHSVGGLPISPHSLLGFRSDASNPFPRPRPPRHRSTT